MRRKFHFYICIGMLLISLSCCCKGKYSRNYSLGFSEESYQGRRRPGGPLAQSCPALIFTFSNQFYVPQKVNDATRRTNWIVICQRRGMRNIHHISETYSVRIIIVEVLLSTHNLILNSFQGSLID